MNPASFKVAAEVINSISFPHSSNVRCLDVGAQTTNSRHRSYRELIEQRNWSYTGMDIVPGNNVDLVVADPYVWDEIESNSFDFVICGQVMEHTDFFWLTMLEIARVTKPSGYVLIIAPSSGVKHRYPVDNWRFYEDGMSVLARFSLMTPVSIGRLRGRSIWEDCFALMLKPQWSEEERDQFAKRRHSTMESLAEIPPSPATNYQHPALVGGVDSRSLLHGFVFSMLREALALRDALRRTWS